jgi:hypothetical protein
MARAVFTGPLVSLGTLSGGPTGGQPREYSDTIGPSILFGGLGIPDNRGGGNKDALGQGGVRGIYLSTPVVTINQAPAIGNQALTVPGNAISGTPLPNLAASGAGRITGLVHKTGSAVYNNAVGMDAGWATLALTSGSQVATPVAGSMWRYSVGQWLAIGSGGVGGATLFAQVTAVGVSTITLSVPSNATAGAAAVGPTNLRNPAAFGAPAPNGYSPLMVGGFGRFLLPDCAISRGVGVLGLAASTGGSVLIEGVDLFGAYQSETIVAAAGAATTWGRKTYKQFLAATPAFSDAHNYTIVTSDLFGCPLVDWNADWPSTLLFGGVAAVNAVFQNPSLDNPQLRTSTDPRGAFQMTANGPLTVGTPYTLDGTTKISLTQVLNPAMMLQQPNAMFGVTPV